ncbi:MAG: hypothetical protein V4673_15085 [Pseudomonadota bacterium]
MLRWLSPATPFSTALLSSALFSITLFWSHQAHAEALACGTYLDAESGARLEVIDDERARIVYDGMAPSAQRYRRTGAELRLFNVDDGYPDDYTVDADGRTVAGNDATFRKTFVLQQATACGQTQPPAVAGSCRADLDACIATIDSATPAALQAACDDDLPFACVRWIDTGKRSPDDIGDENGPPPECREGPTFSDADCEAAVSKALGIALAEIASGMYADDVPLPPERLDTLPALCARHGSAKVCAKVAEELWVGGRFVQAREALRTGCGRGGDGDACKHLAPLAALTDAQLKTVPATTLPCGRYLAETGLMSELDFGDRGLVGGIGGNLRARLEAGLVRIRHDKGGDFVLQRIGGDRLLGIDDWNRYAVYHLDESSRDDRSRDGGATACAAPMVFDEKPLVEDCPQPGDETASACCARGSLHGCNIAGHRLALGNAWAEAKPYYLKVCAAGVRIGCENLAQVFARGNDATVPDDLDGLCATNARHVACDVRETTHWALLSFSQAADELLREVEQELDADPADDAPQPKPRK